MLSRYHENGIVNWALFDYLYSIQYVSFSGHYIEVTTFTSTNSSHLSCIPTKNNNMAAWDMLNFESWKWTTYPTGSMGLVYLPISTWKTRKINHVGKYTIRPMDPIGRKSHLQVVENPAISDWGLLGFLFTLHLGCYSVLLGGFWLKKNPTGSMYDNIYLDLASIFGTCRYIMMIFTICLDLAWILW